MGYDFIDVGVVCEGEGSEGSATHIPGSTEQPFVEYRWVSVCRANPDDLNTGLECPASTTCIEPGQRRWQLWGLYATGSWATLGTQCFGGTPAEFVPPTVTPADVLSALRRVGLPALPTHVQPRGRTLVNLETIFWTQSEPINVDLTILGQAVEVAADAVSFTWHFGDGATQTTESPGAPYPSRALTHRYLDAHTTVTAHVEVTYGGRFRVGGGDWQEIGGTVTTIGPPTSLRIVEATPLLSGRHD